MSSYAATIYDTTSGEILRLVILADTAEADANCESGTDHIAGHHDPAAEYVDLGGPTVATRPVVPVMTTATYDLNDLPAGGSLVITDAWGGSTAIEAQDDTVAITDPGVYSVASNSPFPWVDFVSEVTVT